MRPAGRLTSAVTACALTVSALLAAALGTAVLSACGSCDSIVRQTALPVLAAGTFDGVAADQSAHQLYFADRSRQAVDMVDVSGASPRFMGSVDLPDSPNGLAAAPTLHRVYAGMDGGHVAVIDTDRKSQQFMQVVDTVLVDTSATAPTADLMDYSPSRHTLYVATADNGSVVAMDTQTDKVTATFALNTVLEQPRFDPADGKLYVTAPHIDSLLQLDPATGKVLRTYRVPAPPRPLPRPTAGQPTPAARQSPVLSGCRPTGLGINPSRQLALVACRGTMAVFNLRTGLDQISTNVQGGDIVAYDENTDRFTVGSAHGPRDSSVGVYTGDARFVGMVASSPNAHGAVFDDRTATVYAVSPTGLLGFSPAACAPPPDWLTFVGGAAVYFVPMALFALFLVAYARRRSRPDLSASRRQTREEMQREDLETERQRIRALEDAIYGPEP